MLRSRLLVSLLVLTAGACSVDDDAYTPSAPPEESDSWEGGKEDAPSPGPEVPAAEQSADIGQFFMVDHYGVTPEGYADIRNKIKTKNLGAIILWNPTNASGETLRTMIRGYSQMAADAGRDELFFASDQEEKSTQRFSAAHGFTGLFGGNVLGDSSNVERVCELHARITAREMASAGMNMSLGTVSDLYTRDSGTRGMFRQRAIDSDPNVIGPCITAMSRAYREEGHVVFITKHFPGLGNASGNTDVDASVHTRSTTKIAMERELAPYRAVSQAVTAANGWNYFGAMISHASYPILDGSNSPGTLSSTILTTFLRGSASEQLALGGKDGSGASPTFAGMGFRGLAISDAFWTWGATRGLTAIQRQRLMARAFLAGNDILMIAKSDFSGAWGYFQLVYADRMPEAEKQALAEATGMRWDALRAKFRARIEESAARIRSAKAAVGRSTTFTGTGPARNASSELTAEYRALGG
ncbi:MAG: glycoside hydrolase family 3 N-terminal domain-containing protein [Kofleriaceae bacterium]|nr:glycoside hydrolase family 3 N-terminal domain-containing protein [Kofleriaceae bacterium]